MSKTPHKRKGRHLQGSVKDENKRKGEGEEKDKSKGGDRAEKGRRNGGEREENGRRKGGEHEWTKAEERMTSSKRMKLVRDDEKIDET